MASLEGLRVVEIADDLAGSVSAMLMADHGAEVFKIERPVAAAERRDPGFAAWNRGKKSRIVDAGRPADLEWLAAQVRGADLCILGHGRDLSEFSEAVAAAARSNAGLITLRLPAWLEGKAGWAGGQPSHGLLTATAGLGMRQSSNDGGPVDPISPFIHYVQALWGACCALAALYQRGEGGHGQEVVVTGAQAMMEALIHPYSVDPHAPDPATDIGSFGRHPTYRPYEARDGFWVASGALGVKFEVRMMELLGIPEILEDPRIGGNVDRLKHPDHLDWAMEKVGAAFKTRDRDEWIALMREAGIPCGPVRPRDELMDDPQIAAIGMRVEVDDPERGPLIMPGVPVNLTRTPGRVAGPAPRHGEHNDAPAWQARPRPEGPVRYAVGPLSGVKVLNLGTFVATPYAGMLLSELGANVIKVEALSGDPFRANGYPHNRGMRSLAVDLTRPEGQTAFKAVARHADIVLDGMRPGVMRRLSIDHEALEQENPGILTMSLSAYGETGPLAALPGVDMVIQGVSGIMTAQGNASEPVAATVAYVDVATASMSVFTCLLGLLARRKTGEGQHMWDSLLGTACYLQMGELTRFTGRPPARQGGPDFRGDVWHDCYYRAADGWVRVDASADPAAAAEALAAAGLVAGGEIAEDLARSLAALDVESAVRRLADASIPAVRARRVSELFLDPDLMASEFAHFRPSVTGSIMSLPGRYARFSRTQRWGPMYPPGIGEHTRPVLEDAGLAPDEIEALVGEGVVRIGEPMPARFGVTYR